MSAIWTFDAARGGYEVAVAAWEDHPEKRLFVEGNDESARLAVRAIYETRNQYERGLGPNDLSWFDLGANTPSKPSPATPKAPSRTQKDIKPVERQKTTEELIREGEQLIAETKRLLGRTPSAFEGRGQAALRAALTESRTSASGLPNRSGFGDELDVRMGLVDVVPAVVSEGNTLTLGALRPTTRGGSGSNGSSGPAPLAAAPLPNRSGMGSQLDKMMGVGPVRQVPGVEIHGNVMVLR